MSSSYNIPTVLNDDEKNEDVIDQKRTERKKEKRVNFPNFMISFLYYIFVNILVFIVLIGIPMLYIIKVSKSDILPDDANLFPYTSTPNNIPPSVVNMNILKQKSFNGFGATESTYSQKATFDANDYLNSLSKGGMIGFLNRIGDPKIESNLGLYYSNTFKQMIATCFWAMKTLFYYFNYLPDWINMILFGGITFGFGGINNFFGNSMGFITILITILLPIILFGGLSFILTTHTMLMGIFFHIFNLKYIFKNVDNEEAWESDKAVGFMRIMTSPIKFLKFLFVLFCSPLSVQFMPMIIVIHNFLTGLFQTSYKIKGSSETFRFNDFFADNITYKKTFFLMLLSYGLILNSFSHLGIDYGIGSLIAVAALSFVFGVFKPSIPTSSTQTPGIAK